ncbi:hypothetical protein ACLOJK_016698 [Asimina triloba]
MGADPAWRAVMDDGWMTAYSGDECFSGCHGGFSLNSRKMRPGHANLVSSPIYDGSGGENEAGFLILGYHTVEIRCGTGGFAIETNMKRRHKQQQIGSFGKFAAMDLAGFKEDSVFFRTEIEKIQWDTTIN